ALPRRDRDSRSGRAGFATRHACRENVPDAAVPGRHDLSRSMSTKWVWSAVVADAASIIAFCAIGRRSHAEGVTVAGVAQTAWPFLVGGAVGWLAGRGGRPPGGVA